LPNRKRRPSVSKRRSRYGYGYGGDSSLAHKSSEQPWGGLILEELDRAEFLDLVLIAYTVADGPADDIATRIERRIAIFFKEGFPEDPYKLTERNLYARRAYQGLPEAEVDDVIDDVKERDEVALKMREESEALLNKTTTAWSARAFETVTFQDFLDALAKVKEDDDDEAAWATIQSWRTRRMAGERAI
jgi:hypothetical protein